MYQLGLTEDFWEPEQNDSYFLNQQENDDDEMLKKILEDH